MPSVTGVIHYDGSQVDEPKSVELTQRIGVMVTGYLRTFAPAFPSDVEVEIQANQISQLSVFKAPAVKVVLTVVPGCADDFVLEVDLQQQLEHTVSAICPGKETAVVVQVI